MPAIISIVAKLMVITDEILGYFATAVPMTAAGACNIAGINAELNGCGEALVAELAKLIYFAANLGGQFFAALGAY